MARIGIAHPGAMGAAIGAALREGGHTVLWASAERSKGTHERATRAQLEDVGTLAALSEHGEILLVICPPHAALELALSLGPFSGTYIDANATSPHTAQEIAAAVASRGASFLDGSIIGPPPSEPGSTRLYLSGAQAASVAEQLSVPRLETLALPGGPTAASALKMAYAGWSKGSAALLLAVRAAASALGVEGALVEEWERSEPGLLERSCAAAHSAASKAWRWSWEMDEVAATLAAAGLPDGFHRAAAEVFDRVGNELDPDDLQLLAHLLEVLTRLASTPPASAAADTATPRRAS